MGGNLAISKQKAVELCADMLYSGKPRKEIVQVFAKTYNLKERAVDNYIKLARSVVLKRQEADEEIRARVQAEQTEEVARKLGISREWALKRLKQIADLDLRKIYNGDGTMKSMAELDEDTARAISSVEITEVRTADGKMGTNKKVKGDPRITAIAEIGKLVGWTGSTTAKAKLEDEDGKGNKKAYSITLNLG